MAETAPDVRPQDPPDLDRGVAFAAVTLRWWGRLSRCLGGGDAAAGAAGEAPDPAAVDLLRIDLAAGLNRVSVALVESLRSRAGAIDPAEAARVRRVAAEYAEWAFDVLAERPGTEPLRSTLGLRAAQRALEAGLRGAAWSIAAFVLDGQPPPETARSLRVVQDRALETEAATVPGDPS